MEWPAMWSMIEQWEKVADEATAQDILWMYARIMWERKIVGSYQTIDLLREWKIMHIQASMESDPLAYDWDNHSVLAMSFLNAINMSYSIEVMPSMRDGLTKVMRWLLAKEEGWMDSFYRNESRRRLGRDCQIGCQWPKYLVDECIGPRHWCEMESRDWRSDGAINKMAEDASKGIAVAGILADAMEDAGVENQGVLEHLRQGEWHGPGCWVIESVLQNHVLI